MRYIVLFIVYCIIPFHTEAVKVTNDPLKQESLMYNVGLAEGLFIACAYVEYTENLTPEQLKAGGLCLGFIQGVKNSYDINQLSGKKCNLCIPKSITWQRLILDYRNWYERAHNGSINNSWIALISAWKYYYACN